MSSKPPPGKRRAKRAWMVSVSCGFVAVVDELVVPIAPNFIPGTFALMPCLLVPAANTALARSRTVALTIEIRL